MLVADKATGLGITLVENDMADDTETRLLPGGKEMVDLGPAVKADTERIGAQHPMKFCKGRL